MTKVVEAIYSNGVLEPVEALGLPERQRVVLTVRPIDGTTPPPTDVSPSEHEREAALA